MVLDGSCFIDVAAGLDPPKAKVSLVDEATGTDSVDAETATDFVTPAPSASFFEVSTGATGVLNEKDETVDEEKEEVVVVVGGGGGANCSDDAGIDDNGGEHEKSGFEIVLVSTVGPTTFTGIEGASMELTLEDAVPNELFSLVSLTVEGFGVPSGSLFMAGVGAPKMKPPLEIEPFRDFVLLVSLRLLSSSDFDADVALKTKPLAPMLPLAKGVVPL